MLVSLIKNIVRFFVLFMMNKEINEWKSIRKLFISKIELSKLDWRPNHNDLIKINSIGSVNEKLTSHRKFLPLFRILLLSDEIENEILLSLWYLPKQSIIMYLHSFGFRIDRKKGRELQMILDIFQVTLTMSSSSSSPSLSSSSGIYKLWTYEHVCFLLLLLLWLLQYFFCHN